MRKFPLPFKKGILILLLSLLLGCGPPPPDQAIYVWIDVPINGLRVPVGQEIYIEGHATTLNGISKIEVWVDADLLEVFETPSVEGDLAQFETSWIPPGTGEYNIQSIAFTAEGEASLPDNVLLIVGEAPVEPSPTPIPVESTPTPVFTTTPTSTPTAVPTETTVPDAPVAELWAEPQSISAGSCTMIHWHAENVDSIIFGGSSQAFDGFYEDCFCSTQVFSMTVNHLDGSQEIVYMTIDVTGECVTPTSPPPTVDNTAPPVPAQYSPANGYSYPSAVSSAVLDWETVTDPSGISQYQVEVQKHPGDNNWTSVSFSPITGIGSSQTTISTDSAIYRWRVRAIDGEGNISNWSGWFTFTVPLS